MYQTRLIRGYSYEQPEWSNKNVIISNQHTGSGIQYTIKIQL